jgi:hypothetical protein
VQKVDEFFSKLFNDNIKWSSPKRLAKYFFNQFTIDIVGTRLYRFYKNFLRHFNIPTISPQRMDEFIYLEHSNEPP